MNRVVKHFDRFNVGLKKYWAVFSGQKKKAKGTD